MIDLLSTYSNSVLRTVLAFLKKIIFYFYFVIFIVGSNIIFGQAPPQPPVAGSVLVSTVRNDQFLANWTPSVDSSGYYIDVAADVSFTNILSAYNNLDLGNVNSYLITGLTADTSYYYRLRAHNANGTSINSNIIGVITGPNIPVAISATDITQSTFQAHWNLITEATGYYLDVSTDSTFSTYVSDFNNIIVGNVNFYSVDTNIIAKTTYYYRLRASNAFGTSKNSNIISLKTLPNVPSVPSNVYAVASLIGSVVLNWVNITNDETGFIIERKLSFQTNFIQIGTVNAGSTSYLDNTVEENKTYNYRIKAINDYFESDYSTIAVVTSLYSSIQTPTNLVATATQIGKVSLSWRDNANNETGFVIERKISSKTAYDYLDRVSADVTTYIDNTVKENIIYNYRIVAFNLNTQSLYSNIAIVTSLFSPIVAPSNLTASIPSEGVVLLYWTNNSNNETGFKVERKLNTETDFNIIGTAGKYAASYQDNSVAANTTYNYRVKAFNDNTESNYSNIVIIKTLISDVIEEGIPDSYFLKQNYPNPFNPSTVIRFGLPENSYVIISVYNVLGMLVDKLMSEEKPAGYYEVPFNGKNLPSGTYFYKIDTKKFTNIKKMLLVK